MNLYKLCCDTKSYGSLEIFNTEKLIAEFGIVKYRHLRSTQESIGDRWPESHGGFYDAFSREAREICSTPDIYTWMDVFLVLSDRAKTLLSPMLNIFGEYLPFACGKQTFYVFSLHSILEPDEAKSILRLKEGVYSGIDSISFRPEIIGTHVIFKTPFDHFTHLYCTDKFKAVVETNTLTGLRFSTDLSSKI